VRVALLCPILDPFANSSDSHLEQRHSTYPQPSDAVVEPDVFDHLLIWIDVVAGMIRDLTPTRNILNGTPSRHVSATPPASFATKVQNNKQ
jgi:hypothetical protein